MPSAGSGRRLAAVRTVEYAPDVKPVGKSRKGKRIGPPGTISPKWIWAAPGTPVGIAVPAGVPGGVPGGTVGSRPVNASATVSLSVAELNITSPVPVPVLGDSPS